VVRSGCLRAESTRAPNGRGLGQLSARAHASTKKEKSKTHVF
jgi:hypothetical protein